MISFNMLQQFCTQNIIVRRNYVLHVLALSSLYLYDLAQTIKSSKYRALYFNNPISDVVQVKEPGF